MPPPGGPRPVLSLVVCTRDRVDRLARLLGTVDAQRGAEPFELVVVDNGSTDRTRALLDDHRARAAYPVTVLEEPFAGLGRARNRGLVAARGELIAFTDDDCLLPPDHLATVAGVLAAGAGRDLGFVGGRVVDAGNGQARVALLEADTPRAFRSGQRLACGQLQGANLAVRASAAIAVGGFHPTLGAGTPFRCEDADLCARLLQAGWAGAFRPELVVIHAHGRDEREARELEAANDRARGAFLARRLATGEWGYLADWVDELRRRWGWRPVNALRALAMTRRELAGAAQWARRNVGHPPPTPAAHDPVPVPADVATAGAAPGSTGLVAARRAHSTPPAGGARSGTAGVAATRIDTAHTGAAATDDSLADVALAGEPGP